MQDRSPSLVIHSLIVGHDSDVRGEPAYVSRVWVQTTDSARETSVVVATLFDSHATPVTIYCTMSREAPPGGFGAAAERRRSGVFRVLRCVDASSGRAPRPRIRP